MKKRRWDEYALLLIDVQNDFWDEAVQYSFPDYPDKVKQLLQFCRSQDLEVIHIRALFAPDQSDWMVPYRLKGSIPCISGTKGAEVLDWAREQDGEKVFFKQTFDSFCMPQLHEYLQKKGKRFLLTAGLVTSICVFLTTASAVQKGYLVSLVEDGCADEKDAHRYILERYAPVFMPLVRTDGIDANWSAWQDMLAQLNEKTRAAKVWADRKKS
jgi:ureidoacrylate peracid hydrolase